MRISLWKPDSPHEHHRVSIGSTGRPHGPLKFLHPRSIWQVQSFGVHEFAEPLTDPIRRDKWQTLYRGPSEVDFDGKSEFRMPSGVRIGDKIRRNLHRFRPEGHAGPH